MSLHPGPSTLAERAVHTNLTIQAHKSSSGCLPGWDGYTYFRKSVASAFLCSGWTWFPSINPFRAQRADVLMGRTVARSEEKRKKDNYIDQGYFLVCKDSLALKHKNFNKLTNSGATVISTFQFKYILISKTQISKTRVNLHSTGLFYWLEKSHEHRTNFARFKKNQLQR